MRLAILAPVAWRTPPRHYGPWEQVASSICEGMVQKGLDVTLFATLDSVTNAKLDGICEQGYEEDRSLDGLVQSCLHISYLMEKAGDFDIIHSHFDFLPLSYSRLIPTPMVTTIHGFSSPRIHPVYQRYNNEHHYVSISYADRINSLNYIANVYNGIEVDRFSFVEEAGDYLLFFGRIHPDKGTHSAIEIAEKAGKPLIIAGIIQDQSYFDTKVKPRLNDQIRYVGSAGPDERNELLGNALALLHPIYFDEPFGLSVAESMICGTPVVAFNRGSMPELIQDEKTGYLVNRVDEAVEAVLQVTSLNRKHCREYAIGKFSTQRMVDGYFKVYQKILG
jgi:glycosyltransferase involved in cell wall biosynthesis